MTETNQTDRIPSQPGPYSEAAAQPTPPAAANGYGSPGMVRAGETEHGDAVWLDARGVHAATMATLTVELAAAYEALAGVQARCTAMLEERRAVDWTAQLRTMFRAFEQDLPERPAWPSEFVVTRRRRLIQEEAQETYDALEAGDMVEAVDGFVDLAIVALGGLLDFGADPRVMWHIIHESNMAKASGPVSSAGKKQKPPGWVPPDVRGCLIAMGWSPPKEAA